MKSPSEFLEVFKRHSFTVPAYVNDSSTAIQVFFRRVSDNDDLAEGYQTYIHCLESDAPAIKIGHRIRVNGDLYTASNIRSDGRGWVTIFLEVKL